MALYADPGSQELVVQNGMQKICESQICDLVYRRRAFGHLSKLSVKSAEVEIKQLRIVKRGKWCYHTEAPWALHDVLGIIYSMLTVPDVREEMLEKWR